VSLLGFSPRYGIHFDRAIEFDPSQVWVIASRGLTYRVMQRYDEALADLGRAIELDPSNAEYLASRGQTYHAMERFEEALADYNRASELDPTYGPPAIPIL
jgi:tetratricopeptide (TPR) repeat protein